MGGRLYLENRGLSVLVRGADIDCDGDDVFLADRSTGEKISVCVENIQSLIMGPMSTISTKAVRQVIDGGCPIVWMSKAGLRIEAMAYASVLSNTVWLHRQVASVSRDGDRRATARRSLSLRFGQDPPQGYTFDQLRGWGGLRMDQLYRDAARGRDMYWSGRTNDGPSDVVNSLISSLNAVIYSACEIATASMGMCAGLGFLHVGLQGWIYDVAEHFKTEHSIRRALDWFQTRPDYMAPMESPFMTAWDAIPEIFNEVFQEFVTVCDDVLVKCESS